MELLEEIVAREDADAHDADAQQRFHALAFPAKHGAQVIKHLSTEFGSLVDLGFPHLKRMKKYDVLPGHLIALIIPVAHDESKDLSEEQTGFLSSQFSGSITIVEVLKRGPKTREACELHTKRWPLIFHASIAQEIQIEPITPAEVDGMTGCLERAVRMGEAWVQRELQSSTERGFCCSTGCVVADPDLGGYSIVADSDTHSSDAQYSFRSIFHPAMIAIDGVARRDRARDSEARQHPRKLLKTNPSDQATARQDDDDALDAPLESYLCTGYDVFVDMEPCVMCAMALVHSRARRVIFARHNPTDGALASVYRLHTIKSLNHRYRVFYLRLPEQSSAS